MTGHENPATWDRMVRLGLLGALLQVVGGSWDISWHLDQGRETFWSPPHLVLYAGILLVLGSVATGLSRRGAIAPPPLRLVVVATALQLSSAPFDELWHRMYGLDVTVWSPPHFVLIAGAAASFFALATAARRSAFLTEAGAQAGFLGFSLREWQVIALCMFGLAWTSGIVQEWEWPNIPAGHPSQARPVWAYSLCISALFPFSYVLTARLLGRRGAMVALGAAATLLRLLIWILLIARRSQPYLPGPIVLYALAAEAALWWGSGDNPWQRWWRPTLAGSAWTAAYHLLAPLAPWVYGGKLPAETWTTFWYLNLAAGAASGYLGARAGAYLLAAATTPRKEEVRHAASA